MEEELCKARCGALEKVADAHIAVVTERLNGMDRAVELKTEEMERRLEGLNELRSEVIKDREMLVRKEGYDLKMRMFDAWITEANEKLTTLMINYNNRISLANWLAIVAIVVSIGSLLTAVIFLISKT